MEILKSSNVNWNRVITCKDCGAILQMTEDDITICFNEETEEVKRMVQCPECWAGNKVEVSNHDEVRCEESIR